MTGVRKNVKENVEVENVTEVTQEVKPGLLDKVKTGVKNFWSKHKTKIVVGTALVGAGMLAGAKLVKEEDDEEEVYLIEVEADFEEVTDDEESEETTEKEDDDNEETED